MINGKTDIHYNAMPIKEMEQMKINEIADNDCLLFMWVTSPFLKIGIDLMNKWGFDFSTIGFVWYKEKINPGSYTLSECEVCLIGKRGKIPTANYLQISDDDVLNIPSPIKSIKL